MCLPLLLLVLPFEPSHHFRVHIPLFQQYIAGCVNSSAGTFVSNNLYSVAFNYVTMQGNSASVMVTHPTAAYA